MKFEWSVPVSMYCVIPRAEPPRVETRPSAQGWETIQSTVSYPSWFSPQASSYGVVVADVPAAPGVGFLVVRRAIEHRRERPRSRRQVEIGGEMRHAVAHQHHVRGTVRLDLEVDPGCVTEGQIQHRDAELLDVGNRGLVPRDLDAVVQLVVVPVAVGEDDHLVDSGDRSVDLDLVGPVGVRSGRGFDGDRCIGGQARERAVSREPYREVFKRGAFRSVADGSRDR
jgi:hypothetical protein